jgi:hypothetical protein
MRGENTAQSEAYPACPIHPTGVEQSTNSSKKTASVSKGGARGGALSGISDPDLALLIDRWPVLPDATKEAILAMVREDKGTK